MSNDEWSCFWDSNFHPEPCVHLIALVFWPTNSSWRWPFGFKPQTGPLHCSENRCYIESKRFSAAHCYFYSYFFLPLSYNSSFSCFLASAWRGRTKRWKERGTKGEKSLPESISPTDEGKKHFPLYCMQVGMPPPSKVWDLLGTPSSFIGDEEGPERCSSGKSPESQCWQKAPLAPAQTPGLRTDLLTPQAITGNAESKVGRQIPMSEARVWSRVLQISQEIKGRMVGWDWERNWCRSKDCWVIYLPEGISRTYIIHAHKHMCVATHAHTCTQVYT